MIHLVIGRRRRGKTTLAYYMASRCPQLVVFDPRGMIRAKADAGVATTKSTFKAGFEQLQAGDLRELIYTPADEDFQKAFQYFCRCIKAWIIGEPNRPLAVVVDELAFVNASEPAFLWMLRCSQPEVFHIFVTCHRPKDVTVDMRAIADRWFLFQCRQEHDLSVIEDRCTPAVAAAVTRLEGREFVMWDDDKAEMKTFKHAEPWRVELKPTGPARAEPIELDDLHGENPVDNTKLFN